MPHAVDLDAIAEAAAATLRNFREFCGLVEIATMDAGRGFVPFDRWHPEQADFDARRCGRDIVLKSRKIGMTTLEFARDLQFAITHDGVNVLIIGHDGDLVEQAFLAIKAMVRSLVRQNLIFPPLGGDSRREIIWKPEHGGSAIRITEAGATEVVAASTGRSATIHRLHCTENAFWRQAKSTLTAALGSLATNAEVVMESTANGVGNRFHADVKRARLGQMEGYRFHFWPWFEHDTYEREPADGFDPTPANEWEQHLRDNVSTERYERKLAWMRWKVSELGGGAEGLERFLQENPPTPDAAFRARGGQYVSAAACDRLAAAVEEPLFRHRLTTLDAYDPKDRAKREAEDGGSRSLGEALIYRQPGGRQYVLTADIADGGGCYSAAKVFDRVTFEEVASFADDTIKDGDFGLACVALARYFNDALIVHERNVGSAFALAAQSTARYHSLWTAPDGKAGWLTSPVTRPVMWDELRRAIEDGDVSTPDVATSDEVRALIKDANGRPVHGPGSTDDRWTAWAIGYQIHRQQPHDIAHVPKREETREDRDFRAASGDPWGRKRRGAWG